MKKYAVDAIVYTVTEFLRREDVQEKIKKGTVAVVQTAKKGAEKAGRKCQKVSKKAKDKVRNIAA